MKALLLNSGMGKRMGKLTKLVPKCMTVISEEDTIISRQLKLLSKSKIQDVIITTGMHEKVLIDYCNSLKLGLNITYIYNPEYETTNYIYSIYLARKQLNDDILLIHGDLVFDESVLEDILECQKSCMTISTTAILPNEDFKAVIKPMLSGKKKILKIGVEFFDDAVAAQPCYKLLQTDWSIWLDNIERFCCAGKKECYAENALNEVLDKCDIMPYDLGERLCNEIDSKEDLEIIKNKLEKEAIKTVYLCFSTDMIHSGHLSIIEKASCLGKVIIGVLSDEAVASYKRFPLLPFEERKNIISHLIGVHKVVIQNQLSYSENLRKYKPDFVVHGDDWKSDFQAPIRQEVLDVLKEFGGKLIEYPYCNQVVYRIMEQNARLQLSIPDLRRGRLKKILQLKKIVTAIEAHSGITGLIAEKTTVLQNGKTFQFDAMWVSSLCDSTAKGKPDIELVDMSSRLRTIDDIMEVTTKPIILDGDTGGLTEHFVYTVKTLERMGVSAIIIEDKTGLKKNSLFGTEVEQTQDSIENFCTKISAGKKAQKTSEFMIIARIESLILEKGIADALTRANAFVQAGADGIMIHSRKKEPDEIFEFVDQFRKHDTKTPLIVVPTSFNCVTEDEFANHGINLVIYANQLTRSGFPAMQKTAEIILSHHRAKEADELCMPIKEIISLIPTEL